MEAWVWWALGALFFQSIKIYAQNWMSLRVSSMQHVQLLSSMSTILLCLLVLAGSTQQVGDLDSAVVIALIAGVGFALGNILSSRAQMFIPMSLFHSSMRMSVFLPIPVFYFLLDEKLTLNQWTGIFSTLIPLLMIAFFTYEDEAGKQNKKGVPFLVGAIFALTALKIIDAVALKIFDISPLIFMLFSNVSASFFVMAMIMVKRERIVIRKNIVLFGMVFGALNFFSIYMYLKAIEEGVASTVLPFMSLSVFLALSMAEIFPPKPGGQRNVKKSMFITSLVTIWIVGVLYFMGVANHGDGM